MDCIMILFSKFKKNPKAHLKKLSRQDYPRKEIWKKELLEGWGELLLWYSAVSLGLSPSAYDIPLAT